MNVVLPTAEDVRKARRQATEAVTEVLEQARTPLYAALGAGETAVGYARKARTDAAELRGRLDRTELRELADSYRSTLHEVYQRLTVRGEHVYGQLRARPQVNKAFARVEQLTDTGQARVEKLVTDARALTDDVVGRVSRRGPAGGTEQAERTAVAKPVKPAAGKVNASKPTVRRSARKA